MVLFQRYARTHIVLPPTIYDIAIGKILGLGIRNPSSVEIPKLVKASIKQKRMGMVVQNSIFGSTVHLPFPLSVMWLTTPAVCEISDLCIVLYDAILDSRAGHDLLW